ALPRTGSGAERERLRLLLAERRSCQRARLQALNQLKAALVTLDPPLRRRLEQLDQATLARSLAARPQPQLAALRRLSKRLQLLSSELAEIDGELDQLTQQLSPNHSPNPASAPSAPPRSSSPPPAQSGLRELPQGPF